MHPFAVILGGVLGTWLRLVMTQGSASGGWDTRVTVVNVIGAFLLGLLIRLPVRPRLRAFLASGVLGSYTSFSALTIASVDGTPMAAVWFGLAGSIVFGVLAAGLGMVLGHLLMAAEEDV
ncbi:MAG TPA: CrcB family protein [Dermatophilaceae bacterium]|nr:CrcB family protein [Dermatophilaceae bacterium]